MYSSIAWMKKSATGEKAKDGEDEVRTSI